MQHSAFFIPKHHARAFTLIELLTVIAIIAILASILIPTVGAVRENANQAVCGSNIRGLAQMVLLYEGENGVLPGPVTRMIYSPLNPDRPGAGTPHDQFSSEQNYCLSVRLEPYMTRYNEGDPGPFFCRTSLDMAQGDTRTPVYIIMRNIRTNPPSFFGDTDFGPPRRYPKPLSKIVSAGYQSPRGREATELSQIWMIADIDSGNWRNIGSSAKPLPQTWGPIHGGGRNYAFFDGHLEHIKPGPKGWTYPANSGDPGNDS